jgi:peptidoglycan/xylan/chitin deacetylase (PgdA/CDA1 family)
MRAILMLHGVDDSGSVLSVTRAELGSLVRAVQRSGHRIVPLTELLRGQARDVVALTFDDGFASVSEHAAPVLAELGAPATLFLTTERVGLDNRWPSQPAGAPHSAMMQWSDVQRLAANGWDIEAHSLHHPDLRTLSDQELERELLEPCARIEEKLGRRPRFLAYPYGYFDQRVAARARAHFECSLTTVFRPLRAQEDVAQLPRLDAYYLRSPKVHGQFGSLSFMAYLSARGALRRLRRHPGEIVV